MYITLAEEKLLHMYMYMNMFMCIYMYMYNIYVIVGSAQVEMRSWEML